MALCGFRSPGVSRADVRGTAFSGGPSTLFSTLPSTLSSTLHGLYGLSSLPVVTGVWVEHHRGATAGNMPERAVRLGERSLSSEGARHV